MKAIFEALICVVVFFLILPFGLIFEVWNFLKEKWDEYQDRKQSIKNAREGFYYLFEFLNDPERLERTGSALKKIATNNLLDNDTL